MNNKCFNLTNLEKHNNKPFIYERKSIAEENIYSYETILQEVSKCIEYLRKYKVKNHYGIAIHLREHSPSTCILLLGILNHRCHFYCLDLEETQHVEKYLKSSGVKYVISPKTVVMLNMPGNIVDELNILDRLYYLYLLEFQDSYFKNPKLCYTIATSGSTGLPKMVHVPFECIEPNIKTLSLLLEVKENDMIFLGSPATFDPFVVEFFIALESGCSILVTSRDIRLQPQNLLKIMFPEIARKRGVTLYQTTPSLFRLFGKQSIQDVILSNKSTLRCLILGGEDFPSNLEVKSWLPLDFHLIGKRIFNIYGITEVSCWSSIYEFDAKKKFIDDHRVPLGQPLDVFTFVRLVDKFGNLLPHNSCKGELEIGSSVRRCFIPQYDTDIKILESNNIIYRKTGDLVERDSIGNIYYVGRTNNIVKRLGRRLCLDSLNKKVETFLNANNISNNIISLYQKESSKLIFYFVNSNTVRSNEKEFIINLLKENLEKHELPDTILYKNKVPLNCHGKVDHKKILQQIFMSDNSPVKIFKDFLTNVMGFQLDENISQNKERTSIIKRLKLSTSLSFTNAGGTSFQAVSLATEIAQKLEDCLEQRQILEMLLDNNVTIKEILTFLISCSRYLKIEETSNQCLETMNTTSYNIKLLWRRDLKKCIDCAPSIYEDKFVAVGSHSHLLLTVNATTGEKISCLELNDRIECPVVFATSQLALVGCYDGFLYGFNFRSGCILWKLNANGMIKAKPLIMKNMIIIASYAEDYNILAYDFKSLALMWSLKLGSKGIFSSPVQICEKSVLFCVLDGTYALVEAVTGAIKWSQKLSTPIFSTATKIQTSSSETILVLAEVKGNILICKAENGEEITSFQTEGNIFSGITLHHNDNTNHTLIIFGCHDKNVYCLKIEHASKQLSLLSKICLHSAVYVTPIVISDRYILSCSTKGLIVLLSLQESTILASYDLKAEIFSSPSCLGDNNFYVGSRDNYLYAFQLEK